MVQINKNLKNVIIKLYEKNITLSECKSELCQLNQIDIESYIKKELHPKIRIKKKINLNDLINASNYLKTIAYLKQILATGITEIDLTNELLKELDEGRITEFNFRYITQTMQMLASPLSLIKNIKFDDIDEVY